MNEFEVSPGRRRGPGDNVLGEIDSRALVEKANHALDGDTARAEHRKLLAGYYREKERQAPNRLEMATDHDFYDNLQWDPEDAAIQAGGIALEAVNRDTFRESLEGETRDHVPARLALIN